MIFKSTVKIWAFYSNLFPYFWGPPGPREKNAAALASSRTLHRRLPRLLEPDSSEGLISWDWEHREGAFGMEKYRGVNTSGVNMLETYVGKSWATQMGIFIWEETIWETYMETYGKHMEKQGNRWENIMGTIWKRRTTGGTIWEANGNNYGKHMEQKSGQHIGTYIGKNIWETCGIDMRKAAIIWKIWVRDRYGYVWKSETKMVFHVIVWIWLISFSWQSGWWFQPLWKRWVSWDYHSQYMEKAQKCSKPPISNYFTIEMT